jgi:hypothetical protein
MATDVKGEAMGFIDILKLINFDELTNEQRDKLKKEFETHKEDLRKAIEAVDRGLKALTEKPKYKRTAKWRTAGRPTKR